MFEALQCPADVTQRVVASSGALKRVQVGQGVQGVGQDELQDFVVRGVRFRHIPT